MPEPSISDDGLGGKVVVTHEAFDICFDWLSLLDRVKIRSKVTKSLTGQLEKPLVALFQKAGVDDSAALRALGPMGGVRRTFSALSASDSISC